MSGAVGRAAASGGGSPRREARAAAAAAPGAPRHVSRPTGDLRPLEILHVITRLDRGGSSDCTLLQAIGAARRGHRVTLACGPSRAPSPLLDEARRQAGLTIAEIAGLRREISPIDDARAFVSLVRLMRGRRFDVVHTHTSKAGALGRVAAVSAGRLPLVHQPHGHLFYGYHGRLATRLVILAERLLAPLARRQIVLSWRGAEEHLCRGVGRAERFTVVRSGIDLRPLRRARARRDECRGRLGLRPDDIVVGTICRLEPIKGVEDLLRALLILTPRRPRLRLVFAGDGPLKGTLLDAARRAGAADRVTVTGAWVPAHDLLPALDQFALVSRNEGMGRALVEAMAAGVPVLATCVGGMPEVLEEGRAGLLVPPGDPEAIARGMARLLDEPRLARDLAQRARGRAIAFGAGRMNRALIGIYREVAR